MASTRERTEHIDRQIGERLRKRRIEMGLSQSDIAGHLGLAFQQVQKYERGANRIGAGLLLRLSGILEVPVTYFYDGVADSKAAGAAVALGADRELLEMVRAYNAIGSEPVRRQLRELARALGGGRSAGRPRAKARARHK